MGSYHETWGEPYCVQCHDTVSSEDQLVVQGHFCSELCYDEYNNESFDRELEDKMRNEDKRIQL